MRVKSFNFTLKLLDPLKLQACVETRTYLKQGNKLLKLTGVERAFTLDDALDFDLEFGEVIQLTFSDAIRGNFECSVIDFDLQGLIVKVYDCDISGKKYKLFSLYSAEDELRRLYADRLAKLTSMDERINGLAVKLGLNSSSLKDL
ncbi:MAG: hypothetical protein QXY49_04040 [Thermofilaceae archaeon]